MTQHPDLAAAVAEALAELLALRPSTSTVSDALDVLGLPGALPGLSPRSGAGFVAGPAHTLRYERTEPGLGGTLGDYIDDVPAGAVLVLANGGRTDCSVWGDLVTRVARRGGVAGTVIDGSCRDLDAIRELDYPVWSAGVSVRTGRNRARLAASDVPVRIGDHTVHPGDVVCADASGVVAVPAAALRDVVDRVRAVEDMERRILAALDAGTSLSEARATHGYHHVARHQPEEPS
ncbi:RraA family protein [Streptomyces sp. NPDC005805]|uniref:RraA family protein n=1 Tax=Streptomyces sp. NPDC005805 TaxID=3157068 RepID=UPI0033C076AE